jgi:hypothetical protein
VSCIESRAPVPVDAEPTMGEISDPNGFAPETWHPAPRQLYEYWLSIRPPAGLPGRQHVDPAAIRALLPYVFIVDLSREPLRFRYRLVGTAYRELMGCDLTGAYFDEVHPGFTGVIKAQYIAAVEQRRPAYRKGRAMHAREDRSWPMVERVIVPLAKDGIGVDMILGAIVQLTIGTDPAATRAEPK